MSERFILLSIFVIVSQLTVTQGEELVSDPIKDFLSLPIAGHYSDVSAIVHLYCVSCDLDGDGIDEVFVGHAEPWNGDSKPIYFSAYKVYAQGYTRLLPANKDLEISFRNGNLFVGWVAEENAQGMLILDPILERVPGEPSELLPTTRYSNSHFYSIKSDQLVVHERGPLDLRTPEGKVFYARYFGKGVVSRSIKFEDYPVEKLKEMGYEIPDWKRAPEPLPTTMPTPVPTAATRLHTIPSAMATPTESTTHVLASSTTPIPSAPSENSILPITIGLAVLLIGIAAYLFRSKP